MATTRLRVLAAGLLFAATVQAQSNACDLNGDSKVDQADVQMAIDMSVGRSPCTTMILGRPVCNVVMVQRVINASMGKECISGQTPVTLNWTASRTPDVQYHVYRATRPEGPYTRLTSTPVARTTYSDPVAASGTTYYYVTTAVNKQNEESAFSNLVMAVVP